jgi:hypothetical protein
VVLEALQSTQISPGTDFYTLHSAVQHLDLTLSFEKWGAADSVSRVHPVLGEAA